MKKIMSCGAYLRNRCEGNGVCGLGESVDTGSVQGRFGDFGFGGIAVLNFVIAARENNQTLLVFFQSLDVQLQRFNRLVCSSVINSDSDGWRKLAIDACFLSNTFVDVNSEFQTNEVIPL